MSEDSPVVRMFASSIGVAEHSAVTSVMASGQLAQGPQVAAFETEFSQWVNNRPVAMVNSGTSALHLALLALGVGPGDEVVCPSFSFAATANAVALTGATPVFADINRYDYTIDPDSFRDAITEHTKAVIPVAIYGNSPDMTRIMSIARDRDLLVVEDACQAHGATWEGQPVGSFGDAAAFSFYPTKNMTCGGDGGAVVCADESVDRMIRLLRNQGMLKQYENEIVGLNNRMSDLSAAIGRVQLTRLPAFLEHRRTIARTYTDTLPSWVERPYVDARAEHAWHQYAIVVPSLMRDPLRKFLSKNGVETGVYYPIPIHLLKPFDDGRFHLPVTYEIAETVINLPIHVGVSITDAMRVSRVVASFYESVGVC